MEHKLQLEFYRDGEVKKVSLNGVDDIKIMAGDIKKLFSAIKESGLIDQISGDEIEIKDPLALFGNVFDLYEGLIKEVVIKNINMVSKEKVSKEDLDNTELESLIQFLVGYATLAAAKYSVSLGISFENVE